MQNKEEQKRYIYLKAEKKWVEVSEEYYKEHIRFYDTFRKRQQSHGQCVCPKSKFWLCDGDCCNCEFQSVGDTLSLDYITENDDEMGCSHMELITDNTPSVESIAEAQESCCMMNWAGMCILRIIRRCWAKTGPSGAKAMRRSYCGGISGRHCGD